MAAGLAAYSNSFAGVLVFDDEPALARNPALGTLPPLSAALNAPPDTTLSGRPVATLSFALDHARSDGNVDAYHETNLAIHLVNALLIYGIVRRTLATPPLADRFGGSASFLALVTGLLFVVHPLGTSAVTYVVQRVEALMATFLLGTLYAAIRAGEHPASFSARAWMILAVLSCALGMGTKEVMVVAPVLVLLWDWTFAHQGMRKRIGLYCALAGTWIILIGLAANLPRGRSAGLGFAEWPWTTYVVTQAGVALHYLRLVFVPSPLVLDYEWPPAKGAAAYVAAAIVATSIAATLLGLRRRSPSAFVFAWVLGILAPTSLVPVVTEVAAEHRMYLPLAGLLALMVPGLHAAGSRAASRFPAPLRGLVPGVGIGIVAIALLTLSRMTWARNADYHDYDRIWQDTIAKRPDNARARNNYATSLLAQGRFADAEAHLRVAVRVRPSFAEARANLGAALAARGSLAEGAEHLTAAIALSPGYADAHRNLGEVYALQNRLGDAAAQYQLALRILPDDVPLLNRAAWILATAPDASARDGARARELAERAVRLTGGRDIDALDTLAAACAETGDFACAEALAREAVSAASSRGASTGAAELAARAALYARRTPFRTKDPGVPDPPRR